MDLTFAEAAEAHSHSPYARTRTALIHRASAGSAAFAGKSDWQRRND